MTTETADHRTLTEWRTIPGFPKYEITPDGDVRHWRTERLLSEWQNKTTRAYSYSLRKDMPDGTVRKCNRNYRTLVAAAYPEQE
jgi:hypothetical protein